MLVAFDRARFELSFQKNISVIEMFSLMKKQIQFRYLSEATSFFSKVLLIRLFKKTTKKKKTLIVFI